ncbi:MAG TPA: hypothetical protein VH475_12845 [Tepidisphaeraceae bacterium]|jgi:hypothetical protein
MILENFIRFGGVCQLSLLIAGGLAARVLDWRHELLRVCRLSRHMIWTHAAFVVMTLIAFGLISLFNAGDLASGQVTGRWLCGFIAVFWGARLFVQFFVFDATPHLTNRVLAVGYHTLTAVFCYLTIVYAIAAARHR